MKERIPVVLDTDIGSDIDDTWALGFLLRCPEVDVKLITTAWGRTDERAGLAGRFLQTVGRDDIPLGIGVRTDGEPLRQQAWIEGYDLSSYPGPVHEDGVAALLETVMSSEEPITVCAIGPLTNIGAALLREPEFAHRARFVGMQGCVRSAWGDKVIPEYNVRSDVVASRTVFEAPWKEAVITPLDTCADVKLKDGKYRRVRDSGDFIARTIMGNYRIWANDENRVSRESSILYDTVGVHLVFSEEFLEMETLGIRVTDDGYTVEDPSAPEIRCAMRWNDLSAFEDMLVARLTEGT